MSFLTRSIACLLYFLYVGCVSGGLVRSRDFTITHYLQVRLPYILDNVP